MSLAVSDTAKRLIALRRAETPGSAHPASWHELSDGEAYAVQAEVQHLAQETVDGWKVAIGPQGRAIAAPLLGSTILASPARLALGRGVTLKLETEFAFTLASDLPPRARAYTRAEVLAALAEARAAFELVRPRAGEPGEAPFARFLADNLGNAHTVLATRGGSPAELALRTAWAALSRDGTPIASGSHPAGDPLLPLLNYANAPADRLGGLRRGQLVITGSLTGAVAVAGPGTYVGAIQGLEPVAIGFFN
ncbi:MAG: hypothetical protein ACHQF3_06690 [Alphaproteobacteria bacterium]